MSIVIGKDYMKYTKDYENMMYKSIREIPDEYKETGQISGSKIAQPALTAILTMLGVEVCFDDYTLAKFQRGHDVERIFVERVFNKPKDIDECGCWDCEGSHFEWQYDIKNGYEGCTCSIDVLETIKPKNSSEKEQTIVHEIKSVGKMKYDRVSGTGFRKGEPAPDTSHCLQASLYALSLKRDNVRVLIHYVNADDYRITTFEINPNNYKNMLDERISAIYEAFAIKEFPEFIPYEAWQKGKYNSFPELEGLSKQEVDSYVKAHYPEAYNKFKSAHLDSIGGISYEENKSI